MFFQSYQPRGSFLNPFLYWNHETVCGLCKIGVATDKKERQAAKGTAVMIPHIPIIHFLVDPRTGTKDASGQFGMQRWRLVDFVTNRKTTREQYG
jgi:hypothetical protein